MKLLGEPVLVCRDYKNPGLYLSTTKCNFKCVKEASEKGFSIIECQNHFLANNKNFLELNAVDVFKEFVETNPFIECIILSGLDPLDSWEEVRSFLSDFRAISDMEIVIFTGYYEHEIEEKLDFLKTLGNVVLKFGRYDPSQSPRFDTVGEVTLVSGNQYFKKIA